MEGTITSRTYKTFARKVLGIRDDRQFAGLRLHQEPTFLAQRGNNGLQEKPIPIHGVVYPKTTQEMSGVMAEAYQADMPVHVVSRGKNWGYGASAPNTAHCLLIDLSHMNRIIQLDTELGLTEIEAGVSQGQLYRTLESTGLMMDVTGAGPNTSIVGNIMDRGLGHTPLGFRSQHFIASEMVLADGTVVTLADADDSSGLCRIGLGAGMHELLQQNNLAVVTRMRIPLMRIPQERLRCILFLDDDSRIPAYIDTMRTLKEEGVFDGLPHMGNDVRVMSLFAQFDFDCWDPAGGIPDSDLATLRDKHKVARWTLACGIYGSKEVARAKARRAKTLLKSIGKVKIVSPRSVARINRWFGRLNEVIGFVPGVRLESLAEKLNESAELLSLIDGYPSELALKGCYWRNRRRCWRPSADPIADGCGFRWLSPTLPMRGEVVLAMVELAKNLYRQRGFEFGATLTVVSPRVCQAVLSVYFDADNSLERARATQLARELREEFDRRGWHCYRWASDEMSSAGCRSDPELVRLRLQIKKAFDAKGILSPGRYTPIA